MKPASPFTRPLRNAAEADAMTREVQALLQARGLALRPPPAQPTTCCGRGCNGCVWQGYFEALNYWRQQARDLLG